MSMKYLKDTELKGISGGALFGHGKGVLFHTTAIFGKAVGVVSGGGGGGGGGTSSPTAAPAVGGSGGTSANGATGMSNGMGPTSSGGGSSGGSTVMIFLH